MLCNFKQFGRLALAVAFFGLAAASTAFAQNPVLFDTGRQVNGLHIDPFGRVTIGTDQTQVHATAFDPYRDASMADPGSMHRVNEPIYDDYGNVIGRKVGWEWTNNGVPHGNVKQITSSQIAPDVSNLNTTTSIYSAGPGSGRSQSSSFGGASSFRRTTPSGASSFQRQFPSSGSSFQRPFPGANSSGFSRPGISNFNTTHSIRSFGSR